MSHLGDRVAALVDGQLPIQASERAHAHLANCRGCRDAVELERSTKAELSCLSGPAPDADLIGRLLALGGPAGPLPPRSGHVPGSPRPRALPIPPARPVGARPAGRPAVLMPVNGPGRAANRPPTPAGARRRRARLAGAVLGALGVVGAGVGGLVIAAPVARTPGPGNPALDSLVVRQASSARLPYPEQSPGWQIESVLTTFLADPRGRGPRVLASATTGTGR